MEKVQLMELRAKIIDAGYGDEIVWAEGIEPCDNVGLFFGEYVWVVLSSGIKSQIARVIETRVWAAIRDGKPLSMAFGHKGKVKAIEYVMGKKEVLFAEYQASTDKVEWLKGLPFIGEITKWHLAKNLGYDVAKPDRHLVRIANRFNTDCFTLCRKLAKETGYRIATIDLIIWRAANLGFI